MRLEQAGLTKVTRSLNLATLKKLTNVMIESFRLTQNSVKHGLIKLPFMKEKANTLKPQCVLIEH